VAALAGLIIAHGGVTGAVVEALIALAIVAVLVAVWLRERQVSHAAHEESECLTGDE
jgi:hypothetical protein